MNSLEIVEVDPKEVEELLIKSELPTSDINRSISIFLGIQQNKIIIGCIGLEMLGSIGLLRSLAVSKDKRGHGIGISLTQSLIEKARSRSLEEIYLLTTEAEKFFERIGFTKIIKIKAPLAIKETKQYSQICSDSAVVMRFSLDN